MKDSEIKALKSKIAPEKYYNTVLNGSFGKATGDGWHAWNGLCPFHEDKRKGSFVINKITGAFKCFSCVSGGGDIIDFCMKKDNLDFKKALNKLKGIRNERKNEMGL